MSNQTGNISIVGLLVTITLFAGCLLSIVSMQQQHAHIVSRGNTYLCHQYMINITRNYIKKMGQLNTAIRTAFLLMTALPSDKTIIAHKSLKILQSSIHALYLKNILSCKYCSKEQSIPFILNSPYKTRTPPVLERDKTGATPIRKVEWSTLVKEKMNSFIIRTTWYLKNQFSTKVKIITRELTIVGRPNLKPYYGYS